MPLPAADSLERPRGRAARGRLKIGDDWNAITIIALSQNNPLKAIAEFVENSIDAGAGSVTLLRGKEKGAHYLKVIDDGRGVPCDESGVPDFRYVATHVCDSIKRRLKAEGARGLQGEFGIGLLSFWTVGEGLSMICAGRDGRSYEMTMRKGKPGYEIRRRGHLVAVPGTTLRISPLLAGMRSLSGEKIQRYLSAELRDRIRSSGVKIKIVDRISRTEYPVEPREFSGTLLHGLPAVATARGDLYVELYLSEPGPDHKVGLYRNGTRVLPDLAVLDTFQKPCWTSGFLQGVVDVPFLTLTPGTRDGVVRDEAFDLFQNSLGPLEAVLHQKILEQQEAEEERASRNILKSVQTALREAILELPPEEYDWFDLARKRKAVPEASELPPAGEPGPDPFGEPSEHKALGVVDGRGQRHFFEFAGPLFSARITPASTLLSVSEERALRAVGLDKSRRTIDAGLRMTWTILEGHGALDHSEGEIIKFTAPPEPGLCRVRVRVEQGDTACEAECLITVAASIVDRPKKDTGFQKGLPGYTLEGDRGSLWRSRYDEKRNLVVINSGHRDFVYASRQKVRKVRYIVRLFSKELVLRNFLGLSADEMLERLIELSLYTEEKLR